MRVTKVSIFCGYYARMTAAMFREYFRLFYTLVLVWFFALTIYAFAQSSSRGLSYEAEAGTLNGGTTLVADSTASGASAVIFTAPSTGGGSCPRDKRVVTASDVANRLSSGYPAGTELYVPGGPDPWGGCFPGEGNTGIPAGTTLTPYTGSCTITAANTVIDSKIMTCSSVIIRAANVTIKNSKINSGNIFTESGSLMFTDNEVNFGSILNDEGLRGSNYTVLRSNLYGGKRQFWCVNNCTLEDSYLHDQLTDLTGVTHESAARVEQYTTLRHNSLLCNAPEVPPDAGCSANQTGYPDFAPIHHNTMERNLYIATTGGYCSYGGASGGKPYTNHADNATYVRLIENVFQRGTAPNDKTTIPTTDTRRFTCGRYGVLSDFSDKVGTEYRGNMWDNGLLFADDTSYPYGSWIREF